MCDSHLITQLHKKIENCNWKSVLFLSKEILTQDPCNFDALFATMANIGQTDIFFSKPIKYSYENEYRIIWLLDDDLKSDQHFVTAPEAAKVCKKITF